MAGELPTSRKMTTSAGASHGLVKMYGMSASANQAELPERRLSRKFNGRE